MSRALLARRWGGDPSSHATGPGSVSKPRITRHCVELAVLVVQKTAWCVKLLDSPIGQHQDPAQTTHIGSVAWQGSTPAGLCQEFSYREHSGLPWSQSGLYRGIHARSWHYSPGKIPHYPHNNGPEQSSAARLADFIKRNRCAIKWVEIFIKAHKFKLILTNKGGCDCNQEGSWNGTTHIYVIPINLFVGEV